MTREEFIEIFQSEETKWEGDNCYQGLQILSKYTDNLIQGADHDVVWGPDISKLIDAGITKEDATKLRLLNWMIEEDSYLACFV